MYKKFEQLLRQNNVTPYRVHKETGISTATLSDWKNGKSEPKKDKIEKICQYFEVPLSYFYGEEPEGGERYYLNEETAEMAQKLFENRELRVLFDAAKDATPEDLKTTYDMLMALKRKERGENEF
ncbi:helix-turn-helix domain-containing protein [Faecalicatena acetigenes]|uniref:Helix-turn-helix domain-containing protein n=1 Tax=Faecalicatena acetigenes TaxID=2981790 RepID=A0ABT2TE35_9FIRM|nr:helix-turn-helix transcriptional regulator [Faecalicatena acetigenes]MCU6748549.1 helix-turn-helix domain-containing protein [Faecalicatena acetigenes]SCI50806.1 Helix-turn-helix domain [uncultured Clostridium sp.]